MRIVRGTEGVAMLGISDAIIFGFVRTSHTGLESIDLMRDPLPAIFD